MKPKLTPEQRELSRLRQSLMTIRTWARCWEPQWQRPASLITDIAKECDRALGDERNQEQ